MKINVEGIIYLYYKMMKGILPDKEVVTQTEKTVNYLIDNNFGEKEIMTTLINIGKGGAVTPNDLPNELWENSLLEKGVFYYHNILHITSPPPKWDPVTLQEEVPTYFLEMRINFTMEDLLQYYYDKMRMPIDLRDDKKEIGGLTYLLNKYKKMKVEAIDFVLSLIDFASNNDCEEKILNALDLSKLEREVYDYYEEVTQMATYEKANMIVWR